jgi:uncharacterized protein YxeA
MKSVIPIFILISLLLQADFLAANIFHQQAIDGDSSFAKKLSQYSFC